MTIRNKLYLKDVPPDLLKKLKQALTLPNPMYETLRRMGNKRALYACPKVFRYYEEDKETNEIIVGRGMLRRIRDYMEKQGSPLYVTDQRVTRGPGYKGVQSTIELREYQYGVIEEIKQQEEGIIRLDTGFGKTIIAIKLIAELGEKCIFIVPRTSLLEQFKTEAAKWLGVEVGVVGAGQEDVRDITVATIQTLVRRPALVAELSGVFGLQIVDECHTVIPEKSRKAVEAFKPKYRYGLTATPRRTDKQGDALEFLFGPIVVDRELPKANPSVRMERLNHDSYTAYEYAEIISKQTSDTLRNRRIADIVREETARGRRVLVLTKRIIHFEAIREICLETEDPEHCIEVASRTSSKARADLLADLRSGARPFNSIFGTFSLLSTGVDIPSLDTIIFAGDLKSDVLTEQAVGRVRRIFEDKQDPLIIDIWDTGNKVLYRQGLARKKFYEEKNWNIQSSIGQQRTFTDTRRSLYAAHHEVERDHESSG